MPNAPRECYFVGGRLCSPNAQIRQPSAPYRCIVWFRRPGRAGNCRADQLCSVTIGIRYRTPASAGAGQLARIHAAADPTRRPENDFHPSDRLEPGSPHVRQSSSERRPRPAWVKNLVAAGEADLQFRGRDVHVTNPRVLPTGADGDGLPFIARLGPRRMGVLVADVA